MCIKYKTNSCNLQLENFYNLRGSFYTKLSILSTVKFQLVGRYLFTPIYCIIEQFINKKMQRKNRCIRSIKTQFISEDSVSSSLTTEVPSC